MNEVAGCAELPLDYESRLACLAELQRDRARLDAREQRLLAALAGDCPPGLSAADEKIATAKQWVREEVACLLRLPSQAVGDRLRTAVTLVERLGDTLDLVESGGISFWHARALALEVRSFDHELSAAVQQRVLARAEGQSLGDFKRALRRAVKVLDHRSAEQQHQACVADRRVVLTHRDHGMSELWALLPSEGAAALTDTVKTVAAGLSHADDAAIGSDSAVPDARTADQYRADALMSLAHCPGGTPNGPSVQVTMTLATALDLADEPAELAGVGPITAEHARRIAYTEGGTWRRLVTDPMGRLVDLGSTAYRPPPRLDRFVRTRDQTCRFPHCNQRAVTCDLDHVRDHARGGQTCPANLQPLCPRHHHVKHEAGWAVTTLDEGTTRWTSPTRRVYDVPPYLHPTDPPDPRG